MKKCVGKIVVFLARLRKGIISFVSLSVRLFRPHGTTRLPMNGFSWILKLK
jgi:hypothetical protein